tara:strand:- start:236 stop:433 length:198 start_codon:yes stop_codon:yes gene_type:complete
MKSNWTKPSNGQELGKNWCLSVPYHDIDFIEEAKAVAKLRGCKSVSQYVRTVVWEDIREAKKILT